MKSLLTIISIIGFAGVMLFGAFLMVHSGNHTSCLPTLMGTSECSTNINPLEYVRVHLGALTELINAIPSAGVLAAFAILISLLYVAYLFGSDKPLLAPQKYFHFSYEQARSLVEEKLLKWTALHEKRDPSLTFAAST
jgi:hypothetical protein